MSLEGFADKESGFFFFTHANQDDVIMRKKRYMTVPFLPGIQ